MRHFIKLCIVQVAEEMCPETLQILKLVSLSAYTIASRIEDIVSDIISQLHENA